MLTRLWLPVLAATGLFVLQPAGLLAQAAGVAAAVNQSVRGQPPGGSMRTITLGATVLRNERIEVDARGLVQILLADGTTFTVGPNSTLVIDSFVYNPDTNTAQVAATMSRGVFRFIGGRTSKSRGGVRLDTPVGTVGIRGGVVNIDLRRQGSRLAQFDMTFGTEVTLSQSGQVLGRLHRAGHSIIVAEDRQLRVVRTPRETAAELQALLTGRPGQRGGATVAVTDDRVARSQAAGGPQLSAPGGSGGRAGPDTNNTAALPGGAPEPMPETPTGLSRTLSAALSAPPLAGTTGTFTGTASGLVSVAGGGTEAAGGTTSMIWDFGLRSGEFRLDGFAGRSATTPVFDTSALAAGAPAIFSGDRAELGGDMLSVEGGFFNVDETPARRAIGTFVYEAADGSVSGTGAFDAARRLGPVAPVAP